MLVVRNIARLAVVPADGAGLGIVEHAALVIDRERRVRFAGPEAELAPVPDATVIDAKGRLVTPGLVDPHTHPIFAGQRAHEFALRVEGKSYGEIQTAGGGILSTVRATNAASDDELRAGTLARLDRFLANGVTAVEAKSGYALTVEGELRLLRLLGDVAARHPVTLSPTLLAHVPPPGADDAARAAFVAEWCQAAIPRAAEQHLARAVDVYCDAGAFSLAETRRILEAGRAAGLLLRCHAEQFTHTGAADLAAELGARSVEHLEVLSEAAPQKLAAAGTVCTLLPGAALTLRLPWPDGKKLIAAGCRVAIGTDCNPGSSLTESQPLMMSLAVLQMGLTVDEAWRAATVNAAYAIDRPDLGTLAPGARGDFVIWSTDDHREIPQYLGAQLAASVYVAGHCVHAV